MERKDLSASDVLHNVVHNNTGDRITFQEIKLALHERGFGLLMLIFALPLSIPLPVPPGLTTVASLPLFLFSTQMVLGFDSPWLPKWIGRKTIKRTTLAMVIEKTSPYLKKIERLMRPRLTFAGSRRGEKIVGLLCLMFTVSIAIPLPLTNFIPALGIVIMSLGLLSKDGVIVILGTMVGAFGVGITLTILYFGKKAAFSILPWLADILS